MLASGFAGKYPEKVQGLIACEPGGLLWEDIITYVTESRSFSLWSELMNDATYIDQFINGDADDHEVLDYKLSILAAENTITGEYNEEDGFWRSGAVVNSALFEVGNTYEVNLSEGLDNFPTPVLFIYSEYNLAYSDNWAEQISSAYQERTLFKVLGVGHSGIVQDTEAWNTITEPRILTYFEQLGSAQGDPGMSNDQLFDRFDALTFDDVVVVPGYSNVLPDTVDTSARFAADIELATPATEPWCVNTDDYNESGRVYLELADATPAEAARGMAMLRKLVGIIPWQALATSAPQQ